ncbi:MAG: alpha/beta hydrolase [Candidatus Rokuibacteriota bacterium]|nr:MAG: alpha/beta hydrolase [Candidatus Rokubacteria bacterium]
MDHAYADVNGVHLHYVTEGRGPLIVFVHGFPEFWYAWRDQLREFGRDHQAVAPDMRGYNLSAKPADVAQYRVANMVEDLRALAARLGHPRFVLVGHDWGGVVAWAFAIAHPQRLEKLVIVNAPHPAIFEREIRRNPAQQSASRYMLVFRSPEAEAILAANDHARLVEMFERELGPRFTAADRAAYREAWSQPGALTGGLNYYRAAGVGPPSGEGDPARSFGADPSRLIVRVPTLVIWGEQDRALLTGNLDGLEKFVPDLTVRRVPDGSHWVIHESPELVNRYIRDFLAGTAAQ